MALGQPLPAQVGLELGEYPRHVEKRLAGRRRSVHRLFSGHQMCAPIPEPGDNNLQVLQGSGQTIDPGHHQGFVWMDEIQDHPKLGTMVEMGAGASFAPDHGAAGGLKGLYLHLRVLVGSGRASTADASGGVFVLGMLMTSGQSYPIY